MTRSGGRKERDEAFLVWGNEPRKTQIREQCQVCDSPHNLGDDYSLMRPAGAGLTSQLLRKVRQDPKARPTLTSA